MRVGLFGGSFNPPHIGHRIVAETARDALALDRVVWIPANRSPMKSAADLASADHRLAMTRLTVSGNDGFSVSDEELGRPAPSYTVDTVRAWHRRRPDDELFLIMGMDSLASFSRWREPDAIRAMAALAVYPRPGSETNAVGDAIRFEAPLIDIASRTVRERIRTGRSVRYLIPEDVRAYILQHELYCP